MRCATLVCLLLTLGCNDGDQYAIEPGRLEFYDNDPKISSPTNGLVGEAVTIGIVSYGDECIEFDSTQVDLTSDSADITPWDRRELRDNSPCLAELIQIPHNAEIRFENPGKKTIRVHGRRITSQSDEPIVIEVGIDIID